MRRTYGAYYEDAKHCLEHSLTTSGVVVHDIYLGMRPKSYKVLRYTIEPMSPDIGEDGYSNIAITMTMQENMGYAVDSRSIEMSYLLFSPINLYSKLSVELAFKLFSGNSPECIALNLNLGLVYLVNITQNLITFRRFGVMDVDSREILQASIIDGDPVHFDIDHDVLLSVVDNTEGTSALKRGLQVVFNCGVPLVVPYSVE